METLMLYIGFIGAWLLFAGPIYQAVLELQDEDIEIDRIRAAGSQVLKPAATSAWWWIIFPIKLIQEFRRRKAFEKQILLLLSHEDLEAFVSFRSKATAWMLVAAGGFFIAIKETYELAQHLEWSAPLTMLVMLFMTGLSIGNLVFMLRRAKAVAKLSA